MAKAGKKVGNQTNPRELALALHVGAAAAAARKAETEKLNAEAKRAAAADERGVENQKKKRAEALHRVADAAGNESPRTFAATAEEVRKSGALGSQVNLLEVLEAAKRREEGKRGHLATIEEERSGVGDGSLKPHGSRSSSPSRL